MNEIFTRRSVRAYTNQEVESEKIESILRAAMQAPSAGKQLPWEFLVVSGQDNLETLSKYNPYASFLKNASHAIIVLGNLQRTRMAEYLQQDLGAVTQNILLQATALGLGTCWFGTMPEKDRMQYITDLYDLSENLLPYSVVSVGYPEDGDGNVFVDRYDASRVKYID